MTSPVGFAFLPILWNKSSFSVSINSEFLEGLPCVVFLMVPFPGCRGVFPKNGGIFSARTTDPSSPERPEMEGGDFKMLASHVPPSGQLPGAGPLPSHPHVFLLSLDIF